MLSFFHPTPFGWLNEDRDKLIWRGRESVPDPDLIARTLKEMPIARPRLRPKGDSLVERGLRHTAAWLDTYARVEGATLIDSFVSNEKSFETILLLSIKMAELNLVFRLNTIGHPGWTQYRASIRKMGGDEFICRE
jgi:hypothetical protein